MLTFYAGGLSHFTDHLAPIYKALPDSVRGPFFARSGARRRASDLGITVEPMPYPPRGAETVVVASYEDYKAVKGSKVVLVNHGVGQTYRGDPATATHPSYSGGSGRERVILNICPSQRDALNCDGPTAVVGVPRLDPYHHTRYLVTGRPTVAISFHADIHLCPETRWSFPHYKQALIDLARWTDFDALPIDLLGHAHPRNRVLLEPFWKKLGVPFAPHFSEVLDKADLFICDNSSTLYEFASTGRPVLVLNAPWYRRDICHGLRFWDLIPGVQVDRPEDLKDGISWALEDDAMTQQNREFVVGSAYNGPDGNPLNDGRATKRAIEALLTL